MIYQLRAWQPDTDLIVVATMPFANTKLYGRSGEELHDRWNREGAPSAYAGMATHDMPNFCMLYYSLYRGWLIVLDMTTGPNTLSGHYSVTTIM